MDVVEKFISLLAFLVAGAVGVEDDVSITRVKLNLSWITGEGIRRSRDDLELLNAPNLNARGLASSLPGLLALSSG